MKCKDCRFFHQSQAREWAWIGTCSLALPPFVAVALSHDVRPEQGCSLGLPKQEENRAETS